MEQRQRDLIESIKTMNPSGVRLALSQGANPNVPDEISNLLPLTIAVEHVFSNTRTIIQLLLDHGADLNLIDSNRLTPFESAIRLINNRDKVDLIMVLVKTRMVDLSKKDYNGRTPLVKIIKSSGIIPDSIGKLVEMMLNDQKYSYIDQNGHDALILAVDNDIHIGSTEVVSSLIQSPYSDPNYVNAKGHSALSLTYNAYMFYLRNKTIKNPLNLMEIMINRLLDMHCSEKGQQNLSSLIKAFETLGIDYHGADIIEFCRLLSNFIDDTYECPEPSNDFENKFSLYDDPTYDQSEPEIGQRTLRFDQNPETKTCRVFMNESRSLPTFDESEVGEPGLIKFTARYNGESPQVVLGHKVPHHSYIFGRGENVAMAGSMGFKDGKIRFINNNSGHFTVPYPDLYCFVKNLKKQHPNCFTDDFMYKNFDIL